MKNDLINVNGNKIKSYKAIAKSCDGSSYIYLKNKNDVETRKKERDILKNSILSKYNIPLIRLTTNGSREESIIISK